MVNFEVVPIKDLSIIVLDKITEDKNIYACGLDLISRLLTIDLPIKNKNIAIKNILEFIKYLDTQVKINGTLVKITKNVFVKYFNCDMYKEYMKILKEEKVLLEVPYDDGSFYKMPNKKKNEIGVIKQYRIYNEYINQELCLVIFKNKGGVLFESDNNSYNTKLIKTIKEIDIDLNKAIMDEIESTSDLNKLRTRLNKVFSLYDTREIKMGSKVNRIYHSVTNLSRISRKYLHVNGKRFHNIDVKNSQPLLLCSYILSRDLKIDKEYIDDCQSGTIYQKFTNYFNEDKSSTKVSLYKSVFFKFNTKKPHNIYFRDLYPETWKSIKYIYDNKTDITLASILQNMEANIFNSIIPNKSKYYFGLFDAVYFINIDDVGELVHQIKDRYSKLGLVPLLRIDDEPDISDDDIDLNSEIITEDEFFNL